MLGVIENMSGYECGKCGEDGPLFEGNAGADLAESFHIPLLGRLPFVPRRRQHQTDHPFRSVGVAQSLLRAMNEVPLH